MPNIFELIQDSLTAWIFGILKGAAESAIDTMFEIFNKSLENLKGGVLESPAEFSPELVNKLHEISNMSVVPVAGLILTYAFCQQIFTMVTDKNKGGEFSVGEILMLIIKTSCAILLITNAFTIALAFIDVGHWMVRNVQFETHALSDSIKTNIFDSLDEQSVGKGLTVALASLIAMIVGIAMSIIIHLVAWSRIIVILIYVVCAPLPFATLMYSDDWTSQIAQNYIKGLLALMLQGFFMVVCIVIYAYMAEKATSLISSDGTGVYGLVLMIVTMLILVIGLTKTHGYAKSIVGAQ